MDDYLCQSLPYLEDSQASLREVAVRFLGEPHPRGPSVCNLLLGPAAPARQQALWLPGPRLPGAGPGLAGAPLGGRETCSFPPQPPNLPHRLLCFPGLSPAKGEEGVSRSWQGRRGAVLRRACWGASGVKAAVCLGLAGRRLKNPREETLRDICNGE